MSFRLEKLITDLLKAKQYDIVDSILDYIDIKSSGNIFDDLIDITDVCKKEYTNLENFAWFKKRLVDQIHEKRGEDGKSLIEKVIK